MTRDRAKLRNKTAAKVHESGVTLIELLVGLVVTSLLAMAVFTFFLDTSRGISQQNAQGDMWQKGRNALAIMRQAVESAGYGLPTFGQCSNGIVGTSNLTAIAGALTAITASVQSSGSTYDPTTTNGINTYSLNTVTGGGIFGGVPATTVISQRGANISVSDISNLFPGDITLIALNNQSCVIGQITNVAGKGTLNNACLVTGGGNATGKGTVVFNSANGRGSCFQANPNQLFSLANPTTGTAITNANFTNAQLYDLGSQNFLFTTFQIIETPAGSTPTLYMTQYTGSQSQSPDPQPLASGVVDIQIKYGLGNGSAIQNWISPENYVPSTTNAIVAVQIAMLVRGTQYLPKSLSPSSFNILGKIYTVPTSNGPGCLQGNCRHYEYHLFQTIVPVRNGIWGQRLEG